MKFPLFRRRSTTPGQLEPQAQIEKLLVDGFRVLAQLFSRTAEVLEAQRLQRDGYGEQGRFLKRSESDLPPKG